MNTERGTIISWDKGKGSGYIHPDNNDDLTSIHASAFHQSKRRPRRGDKISFQYGRDGKGNPSAINAEFCGKPKPLIRTLWLLTIVLIVCGFYLAQTIIYPEIVNILNEKFPKDDESSSLQSTNELSRQQQSTKLNDDEAATSNAMTNKADTAIQINTVLQSSNRIERVATTAPSNTIQQLTNTSSEVNSTQKSQRELVPITTGPRSLITPDAKLRVIKGVVTKIDPMKGVIVSLKPDIPSDGLIDKSTLTRDFDKRFLLGEKVNVVIKNVAVQGSTRQIKLILKEEEIDEL